MASGEYNIRRKQCEEGLKILKENNSNLSSFRNITSTYIIENKALLSEKVYDRCLYVTQEIERTKKAGAYLKENNLIEFGKLMFQTHDGLSKLYEVSCAELDFLVALAEEEAAIIGARLMGGGFGGCTINLIKKEKTDATMQSITSAYSKKFNILPEVYIMHTSDGTYEIGL